jgi:hypothetical protein
MRIVAIALALLVAGFTIAVWRSASWDPVYAVIALVEAGTIAIILWMGISIAVGRLRRRRPLN